MDTVDWDARQKAWKALVIITILLNLLLNLTLLYRIARAAGGLVKVITGPRGPRFQTLVSLIIGDIFVALFSLVVRARIIFDDADPSCRTSLLSSFYLQFIMPFVYGVGLVVLAVECILFQRRVQAAVPASPGPAAAQAPGALASLLVSAVPWILGIVIALPVTIAGADFSQCTIHYSLSRVRAIVWICQIVPVGVAALAASLNICSRQRPVTYPGSAGNQQAFVMGPTSPPGQPNFTGLSPAAPVQPTAPQAELPPPYNSLETHGDFAKPHPGLPVVAGQPSQAPAHPQQYPHGSHPQNVHQGNANTFYGQPQYIQHQGNMNTFYGQPQYTQSGQPLIQGGYLPPGSVTYTPSGQPSLLPPPPGLGVHYSPVEKTALLFATIVYSLCVIPTAIFQLTYVLNEDRETLKLLPLTVITDLVFWLVAVRTFVTPFFWHATGSLKEPIST